MASFASSATTVAHASIPGPKFKLSGYDMNIHTDSGGKLQGSPHSEGSLKTSLLPCNYTMMYRPSNYLDLQIFRSRFRVVTTLRNNLNVLMMF